jgi:hypothetical protein
MRTPQRIALLAALMLTSAGVANANDFNGSKPLLCVPTDSLSCEGAGQCTRVTVEDLNIPQFIHVDFKAKKLSGKLETGEEQSTPIQNVVTSDGRTILQGAENGRGWSLVIQHDTGEMSVAVAADEAAFVLLGACTTR